MHTYMHTYTYIYMHTYTYVRRAEHFTDHIHIHTRYAHTFHTRQSDHGTTLSYLMVA